SLSAEIGQLTNLQSLYLDNNQLSSLPAEIVQLTNLQFLHLSSNKLSSLSAEIGQLTNLQSLYLDNNQLSSLPAEFGQLTNLQSLYLSENKLSSLPAEIVQLTNLQFLYLDNNQLSSLPAEFGQLTNLQSLHLSFNQLRNLPAEIVQLSNLQSLHLSFNQLRNLPAEIVQLSNLQSLNLSENKLSSLPVEIGQLSNLQSLYLSENKLSSLPVEIEKLSNLQSLNLSENKLSSLPAEIGQLTNLQSLNLSENKLSSLPAEIGQLTNLQSLHLSFNQLSSSLPAEIGQLTNLQSLNLDGNPLESLPPEIRSQGTKAILNFYKQQFEQTIERLYEAKFLIIGEGGAGKTSLAKKIEDENYQLKPDEESTEGIDVIQWKFPFDNDKEFRVNIWDFGGQEIYHQTHQFFLTERSLYALVADTRKENTDFYWWMKVAELLSDKSPILIVKNEKQNRQCQVNERQLRGEFTNLKEVLPTNLKTNRGLEEIKKNIKIYISNLPHVGTELPKTWVEIRSSIEEDSRNYISREEYYKLCETNNLTDRNDMLFLSRFLHDLGVCLHFQDDSTLKHYVILKPEWATNAVYKVLDNNKVINNRGCFTQEELADIWDDSEYSDMQDELLQLMMRFKLCYPIPNNPGNYIAPQLLDINEPKYEWDNSNNLILRYKYEFMPKGIITRFIVETHPFIEEQKLVWRSGVVLNKDETRAEVIENYNQKEIKVRVSGNRKKELLAVVTHELEKIHRSFERLQYQTLVPCNCSECAGSENPYSYALDKLRERLNKGKFQIECQNSYDMVDVRRLIDDVNLSPQQEIREFKTQNLQLQQEIREFKTQNSPLQEELENEKEKSFNQNQTTMDYQDFQLLVDKNNNIRASSEQGDESGTLNLDINKINLSLKLIESTQTNNELLKALGNELYQALFPNDINAQFKATFAAAQENNHSVRLRLIFESPELASLPWEFLYYERTNTFLGNDTQTALSRYIDVPLKKREIKAATLPLKVLVVISSPTDLATLDATGEENLIREALKKHTDAGQIELDVITEATTSNIRQKLQKKYYDVFHFIGHGDFQNEKGYIYLVDENGQGKSLDDETFANFFLGNNHLGLIILNCCRGATVSPNRAFAGTVSNLVRRGIPAVIAMQYTISDSTAKLFADEFYKT
ncbi:MAG: COR domain-containing protein, partial [Cyanobacteriota bacterium]|nr:COR domain-containing protein [Cyanobacteriota bacterium]